MVGIEISRLDLKRINFFILIKERRKDLIEAAYQCRMAPEVSVQA